MDQSQMLQVLKDLLGSESVYFQPPANTQMVYPAIRLERSRAETRFAGDKPYNIAKRYTLTFMSRKQDTETWDKIAALPMCKHSTFFVVEGLNHDVFDIFF